MIRTKSEDAVSPVIGVMLLLVVTIVIAAVVAAFAGGVGSEVDVRPTTVLDVTDISDGYTEEVQKVKNTHTNQRQWYTVDKDGNEVDKNSPDADARVYYDDPDNKEGTIYAKKAFIVKPDGTKQVGTAYEPWGNPELSAQYLEITTTEKTVTEHTVTLSSLHGDSLDLSKISIQVIFKDWQGNEYTIETPQNSFTGTLSPGDIKRINLNEADPNISKVAVGNTVDVVVYYGDYIIAEEEKMTVSRD